MPRTHLKICCIASLAEAELAIAAGADAIGLVSAMPSGPGVIDEGLIAEIAGWVRGRVETFLLTCESQADKLVEQARRCGCSTLQLCDAVAPDQLTELRAALPEVKLVQVIHVVDETAIAEARDVESLVDALLLDSGNPRLAVKELGGTGRRHDWSISRRIVEAANKPVWLAGGLTPTNAAEAVRAVVPFGLDICSGVRTNGWLDRAKVETMVREIRI